MAVRSLCKCSAVITAAAIAASSSAGCARNERLRMPLAPALARAEASGKLAPGVGLFFGNQPFPAPTAVLGQARTNKKTNFANKTDQEGCEWSFLSAMIALTHYAQSHGGNAVVNIRSNYKNVAFVGDVEYECGAGNISGGTAFVGDVVVLP